MPQKAGKTTIILTEGGTVCCYDAWAAVAVSNGNTVLLDALQQYVIVENACMESVTIAANPVYLVATDATCTITLICTQESVSANTDARLDAVHDADHNSTAHAPSSTTISEATLCD
jgi:hypothetical protein